MKNYIKNIKFGLLAIILASNVSFPNQILKASERVPAENIEQFVDVFNRIKEQYVDEGYGQWIRSAFLVSDQ